MKWNGTELVGHGPSNGSDIVTQIAGLMVGVNATSTSYGYSNVTMSLYPELTTPPTTQGSSSFPLSLTLGVILPLTFLGFPPGHRGSLTGRATLASSPEAITERTWRGR
jgi:hypothetical protein